MEDPDGRQCLGRDYVNKPEDPAVFHVGPGWTPRTEGHHPCSPTTASWPHRLNPPQVRVTKTYLARSRARSRATWGKQLAQGDRAWRTGWAPAARQLQGVQKRSARNYLVEISLHGGPQSNIGPGGCCSEMGYPVEKLVRVQFGPIPLGDQKVRLAAARLNHPRVGQLMKSVGL